MRRVCEIMMAAALVAATAAGCGGGSHDETCECCDGTSTVVSVCDDCMYVEAPCASACTSHGGWPAGPMCAADSGAPGDAATDASPATDAGP